MTFSSFYGLPLREAKFRDLPESVYEEAKRIADLYLKTTEEAKKEKISKDWKEYFEEMNETVRFLHYIGVARFQDLKSFKNRRFSVFVASETNTEDYAMCDAAGGVIILYDDTCRLLSNDKLVSTIYHEIVHGLQQHKTYSKKYEKMKQDPSLKDSDELWAQYHKEPIEFDAFTAEIALHVKNHFNKLKEDVNKSLFPQTKQVMENRLKKFMLELKLFVQSPLDNYIVFKELPLPLPFRTFVEFLKDIYKSPEHWQSFKKKLNELLKQLK
jgi:hypothetical protein